MHSHCNCKAGLGEVCSHVATTLFYVQKIVQMENAKTCTDGSNQWAFPRPAISIPYLPISKIQFKPLKSNQIIPLDEKPADKIPSLTQSQIDNFFKS